MRRKNSQKKATTFQIVGTFLIVVSAFILIAYVFVEKAKQDILQYKEAGKEYTVIAARKIPEYTQLSTEQGAYQAVYEVGIRGGYNNRTIRTKDYVWAVYGTVEIPTAVWYTVDGLKEIPPETTVLGNISEVIKKDSIELLRQYAPSADFNLSVYENAEYKVQRTKCRKYTDPDKYWCFNITIPANQSTKGSQLANTSVTGAIQQHVENRFFELYDLLKYFVDNNVFVRAGWTYTSMIWGNSIENLMASRLEPSPPAPPGYTAAENTEPIKDWAVAQGGRTEYSGTGYCQDAVINYAACPIASVPTNYSAVNRSIQKAIGWLNDWLNVRRTDYKDVVCTAVGCSPSGTKNAFNNPFITAATDYSADRIKWELRPENSSKTEFKVYWDSTDDRYTVLWWSQDATGASKYPFSTVAYKQDTQPANPCNSNSVNNLGLDRTSWDSAAPHNNFPEGTASCDSFYCDCHSLTEYVTWYNAGSAKSWSNCDYQGDTDPTNHYTDCSDVTVTSTHYSCSGCGESTCCSSWNTYSGISGTRNPIQAHCDICYDFYAHFKYRAEVDPILVTITDMSKTIPAVDINGVKQLLNPVLSMIDKVKISEAPLCGDGCCDMESGEEETGGRYYCAADCTGASVVNCPVMDNGVAPRTPYYTGAPGVVCSPGCTSDIGCVDLDACTINKCSGVGTCAAACTTTCNKDCTPGSGCCGAGQCGAGCTATCTTDADCGAQPQWKCRNPGKCNSECYDSYSVGCRNSDSVCPSGCTFSTDNDCCDTSRSPCRGGDGCCPTYCDPIGYNATSNTFGNAGSTDKDCCASVTTCGAQHVPAPPGEVNNFRDGCCPAGCTNANDKDCP